MAETVTYEKADDYTLRKIEVVQRVVENNYDDLKKHLTYLQNAKKTNQEWYDAQIEKTMLDIAEADKLSVVSLKEAVTIEESVIEEITEIQ